MRWNISEEQISHYFLTGWKSLQNDQNLFQVNKLSDINFPTDVLLYIHVYAFQIIQHIFSSLKDVNCTRICILDSHMQIIHIIIHIKKHTWHYISFDGPNLHKSNNLSNIASQNAMHNGLLIYERKDVSSSFLQVSHVIFYKRPSS